MVFIMSVSPRMEVNLSLPAVLDDCNVRVSVRAPAGHMGQKKVKDRVTLKQVSICSLKQNYRVPEKRQEFYPLPGRKES